ncbi:NAD-dependent aldehyde dehydrogenase [Aspergillus karnatakaensis]|uniref:NAD-dependent succinate-semialdehyde dehydrogenase n=1 Tax=Aspergillus karnatakaensis TaxID=1810916 RepID=UPI003CCD6954
MGHTVPELKDKSLFIEKCLVNGEWVLADSGEFFEVRDPSNGDLIGTCPEFNTHDAEKAILSAAAAFPSFRRTLARDRARMLRRWYQLMADSAEDIATLITWENGKAIAEARGEAAFAASFLEWFSEEAPRVYGDTIPSSVTGNRVIVTKEPVGVCTFVTPWNFPAAMITRKVGPALAAGCTVIVKTPAETPFTANAIAELARRAGIPNGVLNFITTNRNVAVVGELLATHPAVRKVSFTGSTAVGRLLMRQASSTVKRVSWELGGNAPFIVFDDADIDAAVTGAILSKFRGSGQTCICANRIYIQSTIYNQFAQKFADEVRKFKVGPGFEAGVTHGPLIHQRAVDKVHQHVQDAMTKGATVLVGGERASEIGNNFYLPTVLTNVTSEMQISCEETFGPVAGLFAFQTEKDVVEQANSSDVGLAAYFYTADIKRVMRVAEALEVGMVGVNTGLISDVASPFGGVKQSGFGREGSKYGIEEFIQVKTMTLGGVQSHL